MRINHLFLAVLTFGIGAAPALTPPLSGSDPENLIAQREVVADSEVGPIFRRTLDRLDADLDQVRHAASDLPPATGTLTLVREDAMIAAPVNARTSGTRVNSSRTFVGPFREIPSARVGDFRTSMTFGFYADGSAFKPLPEFHVSHGKSVASLVGHGALQSEGTFTPIAMKRENPLFAWQPLGGPSLTLQRACEGIQGTVCSLRRGFFPYGDADGFAVQILGAGVTEEEGLRKYWFEYRILRGPTRQPDQAYRNRNEIVFQTHPNLLPISHIRTSIMIITEHPSRGDLPEESVPARETFVHFGYTPSEASEGARQQLAWLESGDHGFTRRRNPETKRLEVTGIVQDDKSRYSLFFSDYRVDSSLKAEDILPRD